MQIRKQFMADSTNKSSLSEDDDEDRRKIFCGNLSEKVTQPVLFELFLQAGPVESVEIPKTKDGGLRNYAFITYAHVSSVPYALRLFADVKLYNRRLVLRNRNVTNSGTYAKKTTEVTNDVVKDVKCVSSERHKPMKARNRGKHVPKGDQSLPRAEKKDEIVQKLNDIKSQLSKIPLRVNNECQIPKNIQANPSRKHCQGGFFSQRVTEPVKNTAPVYPTENVINLPPTLNLPPTFNLTSQFFNSYVYLMQKVNPQWPRMQ